MCTNNHALHRFHETLKDAIDPKGILSPGAMTYGRAIAKEDVNKQCVAHPLLPALPASLAGGTAQRRRCRVHEVVRPAMRRASRTRAPMPCRPNTRATGMAC
jgi:hypothetical protein